MKSSIEKKAQKVSISPLDYVVFSGHPNAEKYSPHYRPVFNFWLAQWQKVFDQLGSNTVVDPIDFWRQDKITAIVNGDEVVAINTLAHFTMDDVFIHPYFADYTVEFFQFLKRQNIYRFQAMQYFMVNEQWRAQITKQNFSAIMVGLSLKQQRHNQLDASITLARKDVPVTSLGKKYGMLLPVRDITMHNAPVSQLVHIKHQPFPKQDVNDAVDYLWNKRIDTIGLEQQQGVEHVAKTSLTI